jgi:hypothetical protein
MITGITGMGPATGSFRPLRGPDFVRLVELSARPVCRKISASVADLRCQELEPELLTAEYETFAHFREKTNQTSGYAGPDLIEEIFLGESNRTTTKLQVLDTQTLSFNCFSEDEIHKKAQEVTPFPIPSDSSPEPNPSPVEEWLLPSVRVTSLDSLPSGALEPQLLCDDTSNSLFEMPEKILLRLLPEHQTASVQSDPIISKQSTRRPTTRDTPKCSDIKSDHLQPIQNSSLSRLFPQASSPSTPRIATVDTRPAVLVDDKILGFPGFRSIFSECRVVVRKVANADIELSERCAALIQNFTPSRIASAIATYQEVYLIATDYQLCFAFIGSPSLKVRILPTAELVLTFVRSLATPLPNCYLRESESLFEMLLCLFPTISRSLALHLLKKGNPISDENYCFEEFPEMNIYPFRILLDAETMTFQKNQLAKNRKQVAVKKPAESQSILSFIPGYGKVPAPKPGSIFLDT